MTVCGLLRLDGADVRRSALTGMLAASAIGLPAARRVHLDGPFGVVAAADTAAGSIPPVVVSSSGLVVVIADRGRLRRAAPSRGQGSGAGREPGGGGAQIVPFGGTGQFRLVGTVPAVGGPLSDGVPRTPSTSPASDMPRSPDGTSPAALNQDHRPYAAGPGGGSRPAEDTHAAAVALARAYRAMGQRALAQLGDDLLAIVWEPARHRMVVSRGGQRAEELVIWSDGPHFAFGVEPAQVLAAHAAGLVRLRRLAAGETMPVPVATRLRRPAFVNLPGPRSGEADVPAT